MKPQVFSNAEIVTADDRFRGYVIIADGVIAEVAAGKAPEKGHDLEGDFLLPGLVELHTDNLEAHYMPRPKVPWNATSAVLSYDAQIAASGITTVFDSLRIGITEFEERAGIGSMVFDFAETITKAGQKGHLRAEHLTHIRCEVPSPDAVATLEAFLDRFPVQLISLMDHTPGQRQFRDLEKYFIYYGGKTGKSKTEILEIVRHRQASSGPTAAANRSAVVDIAKRRAIKLASHDDTTLEEVRASADEGVTVAEFPTTLESAAAARAAGMATVMGGPNVVRGGSHSGNVSARQLADAGMLDILSSDYVPASLLLGAFQLADSPGVQGLPGAIRLASKNPANALGLHERGEIAPTKRADLIRVGMLNDLPVVRQAWREGHRVA